MYQMQYTSGKIGCVGSQTGDLDYGLGHTEDSRGNRVRWFTACSSPFDSHTPGATLSVRHGPPLQFRPNSCNVWVVSR